MKLTVEPPRRGVHDVVHKVAAVGSRSVDSASSFIKTYAAGDSGIKPYGSYDEVYADPVRALFTLPSNGLFICLHIARMSTPFTSVRGLNIVRD